MRVSAKRNNRDQILHRHFKSNRRTRKLFDDRGGHASFRTSNPQPSRNGLRYQIIKRSGKDPSANALIALAAESWLRGAREEAIARYNRAATLEPTLKDPHFLQEWDLPPRMKQLIEAIFRAGMLSSPH
jgi:hypothetical protein